MLQTAALGAAIGIQDPSILIIWLMTQLSFILTCVNKPNEFSAWRITLSYKGSASMLCISRLGSIHSAALVLIGKL